jgi:hypothetical protein
MNRKLLGIGLSMVAVAMVHGQTFNWEFTGTTDFSGTVLFNGSGQMTVSGTTVTAFSGKIDGETIQPGGSGTDFPANANISFHTSSTVFWVIGHYVGGWLAYNNLEVWAPSSEGWVYRNNGGTFTYTAVPEPSTYAAMAGLGMVGFGVWRRTRRQHVPRRRLPSVF